MEKNLLKTKKWAIIARDFPGRTQHDIKNRFIHVLNLELGLKREKIRSLLKNNIVLGYIYETVNILKNEKTNINRKNEEDKINEEIDLSESTQNYQSSTIELEEIFEGNHLTDGYTKEDKDFISNELDVFNQFISFY